MQNTNEKTPIPSMSNELSTLANQLNITEDFAADDPTEQVLSAESTDESKPDEATETSSKSDLVVDDVNCSMMNENIDIETTTDPSSNSEFIHLKKTTTALQSYLEQFQMENIKSSDSSETFDATEELLKMLDRENNES